MRKIILLIVSVNFIAAGSFSITPQNEIDQINEQLELVKNYNPIFTDNVNKLLDETTNVTTYESELWVYNYKLKISDGDRIGFFMITQVKQPNNQDIINLSITDGYILLIDGNSESKLLLQSHAYKGNPPVTPTPAPLVP